MTSPSPPSCTCNKQYRQGQVVRVLDPKCAVHGKPRPDHLKLVK